MERKILTVFLASPSDLSEERKIAQKIVERINKIFARSMGCSVDLAGWEDTLPGFSRPQSLINKDVEACDLFVGLLWKRWGQDTGKYSSGFEEEFYLARERKIKTGNPEIWIFLKFIDEDALKDPGEQLKKVISFREGQLLAKELLFKNFDRPEEWGELFQDSLSGYVLNIAKAELIGESAQPHITEASQKSQIPIEQEINKGKITYPPEITSLSSQITAKFRAGEPINFDIWQSTRFFLQSSVWFSESHIGETFGNHEINLTYTMRKKWQLSASERLFLFRSSISDKHGLRPGWYWIKNISEKNLDYCLSDLSINDRNIEVRRGAFQILVNSGVKLKKRIVKPLLLDKDKELVLCAIKYLRSREPSSHTLLDLFLSSSDADIKKAASSAKVELLFRADHNSGFDYMIETDAQLPELIKNCLEREDCGVDTERLRRGLLKASPLAKISIAKHLRMRKLLTEEDCHKLIEHESPAVKREGMLGLIDIRGDIDMDFIKKAFPKQTGRKGSPWDSLLSSSINPDEFLPPILQKMKPEELLSRIDFYGFEANLAYRVLAVEHYPIIEERIRLDLDDSFEHLKKDTEDRMRANFGDMVEEIFKAWSPGLCDYVKATLIAAALEGLAINGQKDDIKYARKYLGNTQQGLADGPALELFAKYGNASDVKRIIDVASKSYGDRKKRGLEVAYILTKNKGDFLKRLINDDDTDQAKIAVRLLLKSRSANRYDIAKKLLNHKSDKRRIEGLFILLSKYKGKDLETLLGEYSDQETYYYNVVVWMDKYLYSKGRHLKYFRKDLLTQVYSDE